MYVLMSVLKIQWKKWDMDDLWDSFEYTYGHSSVLKRRWKK